MYANSDTQKQQLVDDLIKIDRDIQSINFENDEYHVRRLVDCRRQLLANLQIVKAGTELDTSAGCSLDYIPTKKTTEVIKKWSSRVLQSTPVQQPFENTPFCNQFLDNILPETWDFRTDVMVVSAPPSSCIILKALDRGQRHFVIFDPNSLIDESAFTQHKTSTVIICRKIVDVEIAFAKLQTPARQIIIAPCSLDKSLITETKTQLAEAIRRGKKNRIANTITANRFGASWARNLLTNLNLITRAPNIHQLSVKGVKDAVIVASGPSLNKNIHALAEIKDQVFIVAALRSIQTLINANIKPDLVIQLDAEDDHVAKEFSTKLDIEIENFLVELTVNPWFLKSNAKNFIWSYPSIFVDFGRRFGVKPTPFDAPSVAIYGLTLCYLLGFESLCFVGQDLASSNSLQYAKGATSLLPAHNDISTFNIEVDGFYGNKVMTRNAYHGQLLRCQNIASELKLKAPHVKLFNATEGGAYIKGFEHVSLSEFANTQGLINNRHAKQLFWKQRTQIKPNCVSDYMAQITDTMDQISVIADAIIKLDTAPKISANTGTDIAALIQKFRRLNDTTSVLQIAMQEEISSVTGTSNNTNGQSSLSEFFRNVLRHAEALKLISCKKNK